MRQLAFRAALAAIAAALAVPGLAPAATRNNTLIATDGPGFTITMNKATVKAGTSKRLHTHRTRLNLQADPNTNSAVCGGFAEPSDGLEPSTPSLP
jgi:hypothetical protein